MGLLKGDAHTDDIAVSPIAEAVDSFIRAIMDADASADTAAVRHKAAFLVRLSRLIGDRDPLRLDASDLAALARSAHASARLDPQDVPEGVEMGEGLAHFFTDADEAQRHLASLVTPMPIAAWAGPVAGPVELQRTRRIARSTLHDWTRRGKVVALPKGTARHVYPLEQFVGESPVGGIDQVLAIIPRPRVAWLWLVSAHPRLAARPIDLLKRDQLKPVLDAADTDYGQQV